jgi:uncharacterized protein (DUF1501 family)
MSKKTPPTRRDFLMATAAGLAGVTAANGVPRPLTPGGTAKACIFINLVGGPGHLDTFDPKPDAPAEYRGPFRPIPTRVPGVHLSELFPKLAGMADKFSLIRSMHHTAPPIHECGLQLLNTGRLFRDGPEWPNVGAVASRFTKQQGDFATWVVLPDAEISTGINVSHGQAPSFLSGPDSVPIPDEQRSSWTFQKSCRMAAGLASVNARFITINMFPTVFDVPSWDCHADGGSLRCDLNDYRDTVAPMFDAAFSDLLTVLDGLGLLDTTLVVASGEFGRTPKLNGNGGRDHWANCWTALVAGGGVKGGRVIGASDKHGTEPTDRPVTPQELVATVFHALGISHDAAIPGPTGSPVAVYPAAPVVELF